MLLEDIIARTGGAVLSGNPRTEISGISYDSRTLEKGSLFVAVKGEKTDGARYLDQAIARGAAAFACENPPASDLTLPALKVPDARRFLAEAAQIFFGDPTRELRLVAITGTNGKTTTSYLLDSIFRQAKLNSCLVGTIGLRIGDRPFPAIHTTPEASDLMSFLRQAADAGCTHGALEVSSHALVLKRVYGARFASGIFTNLTPEHLDFHLDMESYYRAKRLLFLPEGGNRLGQAVINIDDPYGQRLSAEVPCPLFTYGFAARADIRVRAQENLTGGSRLRVAIPGGELEIRVRLVGRTNAYNVMASIAAASGLSIEPDLIRKGIESLEGVPGRMELVNAGQDFSVIVDYAHTPDALQNLLETVAGLPHRRVITVFGCGGDRDRTKRPVMGDIAGRMSDFVVATSDNPRSEVPEKILAEIEPGLRRVSARYELIADRREAIACALTMARLGDVVVIAGKGHEDCQIIGDRSYPFDDRAVAREFILNRTGSTELK